MRTITRGPAATEETPDRTLLVGIGKQQVRGWPLLLALFVTFRFLTVLFFKPGLIYMGSLDYGVYRRIGELSVDGYLPFVHYWLEYPPIFPWAIVGIYRLSFLLPPTEVDMFWFQTLLGFFLLLFETGNLVLIHSLSNRIWGPPAGLHSALIYAVTFWPAFAMLNWFDSFPLFFLLLAIWLAVRQHYWLAGLATGLGFMVKLIPVVVVAAVLRYAEWRGRIAYTFATAVAVIAVATPFLLHDPRWLIGGFQSTMARSSWETIWALAEQYFGPGAVAPLIQHFELASASWTSHPSSLPWPLINAAFLGACLLVFWKRPSVPPPIAVAAGAGLTLNLFLIFSKGYSPQFLVYPLAMLSVLLPNGRGVAYAIVLTVTNFVEWPIYFGHFPKEHWMLWGTVIVRTTVLFILSVEYAALLFGKGNSRWLRIGRHLAVPAISLLVVGLALGSWALVQRSFAPDAQPAVASYIRSLSAPGQGLVASSRQVFYGLKPYLADESFLLAEGDDDQTEEVLRRRVAAFSAGKSQVWLLLDHGQKDKAVLGVLSAWYDRWGSKATDTYFGGWQLGGYLPYASESGKTRTKLNVDFAGQLTLTGYELPRTWLEQGERARLALVWRVDRPVGKDYKVFIHLVRDIFSPPIAQSDRPLLKAGEGSTRWAVGEEIRQGYDISLPADLPSGEYLLVAGIYDPVTGQRAQAGGGTAAAGDKAVIATIAVGGHGR